MIWFSFRRVIHYISNGDVYRDGGDVLTAMVHVLHTPPRSPELIMRDM